jgi:hypothetical protein
MSKMTDFEAKRVERDELLNGDCLRKKEKERERERERVESVCVCL